MARTDAGAAPRERPPQDDQAAGKLTTSPRSPITVARPVLPAPGRRTLDGPVVGDLAAKDTPGIAAMDAAWTALVLAGWARDAAELERWLRMCGLLAERWAPPAGAAR